MRSAPGGGDVTTIGRAEDARCGGLCKYVDEIPNMLHIDVGLPIVSCVLFWRVHNLTQMFFVCFFLSSDSRVHCPETADTIIRATHFAILQMQKKKFPIISFSEIH